VASGSLDETVRLWDAATGKELRTLPGHTVAITAVAFSPDGKLLASTGGDETRLWDVATGKVFTQLQGGSSTTAVALAFTSDGKALVAGSKTDPHEIRVWQPMVSPKGTITLGYPNRKQQSEVVPWPFSPKPAIAISKDAQIALAVATETEMRWSGQWWRLFNPITNKSLLEVGLSASSTDRNKTPWSAAAISADGRMVASSQSSLVEKAPNRFDDKYQFVIQLWDGFKGQERLKIDSSLSGTLDFSPDSRLLAAGHGGYFDFKFFHDSGITLYNTLTGMQVCRFEGHKSQVRSVAFSPNGKRLVSASSDHTLLIWDTSALPPQQAAPPAATVEQLEQWWEHLGANAKEAHQSFAALVARPAQTVSWLAKRLQPTPAVDTVRLNQLLEDLDSARYSVRQQAHETLAKMEELAEPALRQALKPGIALEQRRRLELLLGKLEGKMPSPSQLRVLRAIEALEWIGTAKAKQVLVALAQGAAEARMTQEARAALERLARRPD
jgi:hypothetical protein